MKLDELRERAAKALESQDTIDGQLVELAVGILIVSVSVLFVAQTVTTDQALKDAMEIAERGITVIFVVEYLTRWWARRFSWRYLLTPLALVDLAAILPLFIAAKHFQFLRLLRLLRILRIMRVVKSHKFFFGEVSQSHLVVIRILVIVSCIVFITGGVVYDVEVGVNEKFETFFDGLYFAVVTLTTVGYGDLTPITWAGKAATMAMILTGVLIIPWQLTSLARHIMLETNRRRVTCKSCGLLYHDRDASHCKACGALIYQEYDGS